MAAAGQPAPAGSVARRGDAAAAAVPDVATPAPPAAPRGRVPGWLLPAVAALALLVGIVGGAVGAALLDGVMDTDRPGTVTRGLDGVDTENSPPLTATNKSVVRVADQLLPSTVQIVADFEGENGGATGSGFVLDRQGHIVTNNHVVQSADEYDGEIEIVDQDGNRYVATVVGRSAVYDLAVLFSRGRRRAAAGLARRLPPAERRRARGRVRLTARPQLDRHLRHRQRAQPAGDDRRLGQRLLLHQRGADRRRDQPRQLGRAAGQPAGPGRRRQQRDRHDRRRPRRRERQHRRRLRDPDRAGPDHGRPDPAHRRGPLPRHRRQGADRRGRRRPGRADRRGPARHPCGGQRARAGRHRHRGQRRSGSPTGSR